MDNTLPRRETRQCSGTSHDVGKALRNDSRLKHPFLAYLPALRPFLRVLCREEELFLENAALSCDLFVSFDTKKSGAIKDSGSSHMQGRKGNLIQAARTAPKRNDHQKRPKAAAACVRTSESNFVCRAGQRAKQRWAISGAVHGGDLDSDIE